MFFTCNYISQSFVAYLFIACKIYSRNFSFNIIKSFKNINDKQANLINCWDEDVVLNIGESSEEVGKYAYLSLEKAKEALKNNEIDVLVTAPINKSSIQKNKEDFIGHTEYLEQNFEGKSLMMMISSNMKIAFVTSHVPLVEVPKLLTKTKISEITDSNSLGILSIVFSIKSFAL